jgi:hypothetical protein
MARSIIKTVYPFNELSDSSKEKAREWFRLFNTFEPEFDDFVQVAAILGITFKEAKRGGVDIFYSGFSSQGDGACYNGNYSSPTTNPPLLIREYAPQDAELHRIADELEKIQAAHDYDIVAKTWHEGHYYHEYCMDTDVHMFDGDDSPVAGTADAVVKLLRAFAKWIYKQLNDMYDYEQSNEYVDECIVANEYEFYEDGTHFGG